MKMIYALIATFLTGLAPQLAQADISCLDAGGYYGMIALNSHEKLPNLVPQGMVQIYAAQGYSYEISTQFGFPRGREASAFYALMPAQQCRQMANLIECQGPAKVTYSTFDGSSGKLDAVISFRVVKNRTSHSVSLAMKVVGTLKSGAASHEFLPSLGTCIIR